MESIPINREILLYIIEGLRKINSSSEELIPSYTENEIEELLSCVERVYHGYYRTFEERLCNVLYNVTKGHYLCNGNKRVATILTISVYHIENSLNEELKLKYKKIDVFAVKELTLKVAENSISKEELLNYIKDVFI